MIKVGALATGTSYLPMTLPEGIIDRIIVGCKADEKQIQDVVGWAQPSGIPVGKAIEAEREFRIIVPQKGKQGF